MALFRAVVEGRLFGQLVVNVLHFHRPDAPANAALLLAQSLNNHWYNQVKNLCNSDMNWNLIKIYEVDGAGGGPLLFPTNISGTWSGHHILWGPLCGVFQIKTATGGRKGRGRFYVSGQEPHGILNGVWETGRLGLMQSVANSLKSGYVGTAPSSNYNLGILPRTGTTSADFIPATDIVPRPLPGTQGRRNIGRGK